MASLSQGRTAAAPCGLFTHKSVPVIFEPPCIFVDTNRLGSTITLPLITGLSDHDVQLLTINNTFAVTKKVSLKQKTRIINSETLTDFQ